MSGDAIVLLTGLLERVHVDDGPAKVTQAVPQPVVDLAGYGVALGYGEVRGHRHVHLRVQPVPQPSGPDLRDVLDAWHVASGVPYLLHGPRLHAVQQAGE